MIRRGHLRFDMYPVHLGDRAFVCWRPQRLLIHSIQGLPVLKAAELSQPLTESCYRSNGNQRRPATSLKALNGLA